MTNCTALNKKEITLTAGQPVIPVISFVQNSGKELQEQEPGV